MSLCPILSVSRMHRKALDMHPLPLYRLPCPPDVGKGFGKWLRLMHSHIDSATPSFSYDMQACPILSKCLLLNWTGICVIGAIEGDTRKNYAAWAPLPKRNKQLEQELGIKIGHVGNAR